jgi:putative transposase
VIETVEANLSQGMRQLNGVYTQASNRIDDRLRHLFRGRFKGILVDKDAYLLELSRYVVLNPVRVGMVDSLEQWPWSSYRAMIGASAVPKWLTVEGLLRQFAIGRGEARQRYRRLVLDGVGRDKWEGLRQQTYLGDEAFVEGMQDKAEIEGDALTVPQAQRRPPNSRPLASFSMAMWSPFSRP